MYKVTLTIILIISLLFNSARQGYALRPVASNHSANFLKNSTAGNNKTDSAFIDKVSIKDILNQTLEQIDAEDRTVVTITSKKLYGARLLNPDMVNGIKGRLHALLTRLLSQLPGEKKLAIEITDDEFSWYLSINEFEGQKEEFEQVQTHIPVGMGIVYNYPWVPGVEVHSSPEGIATFTMPIAKSSVINKVLHKHYAMQSDDRVKLIPTEEQLDDLDILLENEHSGFCFELGLSNFIFNWAGGLDKKIKVNLSIEQDDENVYICLKDAVLFSIRSLKRRLEKIRKNRNISDLVLKLEKWPRSRLKIVFPKKELKKLADSERRVRARTAKLIDYLIKISESLNEDKPPQARLKELIPHLCRALRSQNTEARYSAILAFKNAPPEIARYVAETFIYCGDEIELGEDGRPFAYSSGKASGIPDNIYDNRYWDIDFPLRLAAIDLIAAFGFPEYSDKLFKLLEPSFCVNTTPHHDSSHYAKLQRSAVNALAKIAKHNKPTLDKLIYIVSSKHKAPWWVKQVCIRALGQTGTKSNDAVTALKEVFEFETRYSKSVTCSIKTTKPAPKNDAKKLLRPSAIVALGRLKAHDIKQDLIEMLPDNKVAVNDFSDPGSEAIAAIESISYLEDKATIPDLLQVSKNRLNHHAIRSKALWAMKKIDPDNKDFQALLVEIWNDASDLTIAFDTKTFKPDPNDQFAFLKYVQQVIERVQSEKPQKKKPESKYVKSTVRNIFIDYGRRPFIDMVLFGDWCSPVVGADRPNWKITGEAIKKLLSRNPHDKKVLDKLTYLFKLLGEYWSTTYIVDEDINIYGEIIASLDYKYLDTIFEAVELIELNEEMPLGTTFRPQVGRVTLTEFTKRLFKANKKVFEEVPFSPEATEFTSSKRSNYLTSLSILGSIKAAA